MSEHHQPLMVERNISTEQPAAALETQRPSTVLWLLLIAAAGVAAYANSYWGAFVLDDLQHIVNVRGQGLTVGEMFTDHGPRRWVLEMTLALNATFDRAVLGVQADPRSYHVVNIAIHVLAALTLFGLLRRLFGLSRTPVAVRDSADALALAIALLWVVHPLNTQAVTYVIQRTESLMGLFYLLTAYALVRLHEASGRTAIAGWAAATVAAFALGLGTKEVMVTAPLVLLLVDRAFLTGRLAASLRRRWWLYGLMLIGAAWMAAVVLGIGGGPEPQVGVAEGATLAGAASAGWSMPLHTPGEYAANQSVVMMRYLRLVFWPVGLTFDYGWQPTDNLRVLAPAWGLIGLMGLWTLWALWRRPRLGTAMAAFFIILAPTSSVVPIADMAAEYRMYLPLISVIALTVLGAWYVLGRLRVGERSTLAAAVLAVVVLTLAGTTFLRNMDYYSAESLWRDTVRKAPNHPRAHDNLGMVLLQKGDVAGATACFQRVLELVPNHANARVNLGVALQQQGQTEQAVAQFAEVLVHRPNFVPALHHLALVLAKAGRLDEATNLLERAVTNDPQFAEGYADLGTVLMQRGELEKAAVQFEQAVRLKPAGAQIRNSYGIALARLGRTDEARVQFERAVTLEPGNADYRANYERARN